MFAGVSRMPWAEGILNLAKHLSLWQVEVESSSISVCTQYPAHIGHSSTFMEREVDPDLCREGCWALRLALGIGNPNHSPPLSLPAAPLALHERVRCKCCMEYASELSEWLPLY